VLNYYIFNVSHRVLKLSSKEFCFINHKCFFSFFWVYSVEYRRNKEINEFWNVTYSCFKELFIRISFCYINRDFETKEIQRWNCSCLHVGLQVCLERDKTLWRTKIGGCTERQFYKIYVICTVDPSCIIRSFILFALLCINWTLKLHTKRVNPTSYTTHTVHTSNLDFTMEMLIINLYRNSYPMQELMYWWAINLWMFCYQTN
jgi:hypothetical protein